MQSWAHAAAAFTLLTLGQVSKVGHTSSRELSE